LRANHALTAQKLPDALDELASIGCKTFFWDNKRFSVICFTRRDGGLIHLVMRSAAGEAGRGRKGKLELIQRGGWATATRHDGGTLYMLALEGSREELAPTSFNKAIIQRTPLRAGADRFPNSTRCGLAG
jgi:hypothetical protein